MIGIRSASNGSTEKEKMRNSLRVIVEQLMNINGFDDMLSLCHKINQLDEDQVDQICQNDYYELKLSNDFEFKRMPEVKPQEDVEMTDSKKNSESKEKEDEKGNSAEQNKRSDQLSSPENPKKALSLHQQLKPLSVQSFETD